MNTVVIDRNTLNSLFENQKRLDDLFDTIFDDENYFISSSSYSSSSESSQPSRTAEKRHSHAGKVKESILAIQRNRLYYVLPIVLEVAIIYLVVANFL